MIKRFVYIAISLLLIASLITGCQKKEEPTFTLENYPRVDGSTVTIPLSEAIAATLTGKSLEDVRPYILHNKTHQAYENLINKKADIIFVTSPSIDELALAKANNISLEITPIVSEAFVFLTHAENPIQGLTLEEVRQIYAGNITNWSVLGGDDALIIAYQRPLNSGSQTGFLELVMKDLTPINPPTERIIAGMGELIDAVATYKNVPDALGYSYYYFVVDMWGNNKVKLLEIDGVYPNKDTIRTGDYPVRTAYYAVIRADEPKDSQVRKMIDWILSDEGQKLAEEAGYVKIK